MPVMPPAITTSVKSRSKRLLTVEQPERGRAAVRLDHGIAELLQAADGDPAHPRIVLDDEDPSRPMRQAGAAAAAGRPLAGATSLSCAGR